MLDHPINLVLCNSLNFGDALAPWIARKLTGHRPVYATGGAGYEHYILGGSILNWAGKGSKVWGAGLADSSNFVNSAAEIFAVRGPHTLARAIASKARCPAIFGDPAMLLPHLYSVDVLMNDRIGIVPHYVDQFRVNEWYRGDERYQIISVFDSVESVIDQIASCRRIISSSLHGLIVAHAYGIPAVWAKFSDSVLGDGTKFRDYLSIIGWDEISRPIDLSAGPATAPISGVRDEDYIEPKEWELEKFAKHCPLGEIVL